MIITITPPLWTSFWFLIISFLVASMDASVQVSSAVDHFGHKNFGGHRIFMARASKAPMAARPLQLLKGSMLALSDAQKIVKEQAIVDEINKHTGGLWKAKVFRPIAMMNDEQKALLYRTRKGPESGVDEEEHAEIEEQMAKQPAESHARRQRRHPQQQKLKGLGQLSKEFDARHEWPECADVINDIVEQGKCGSCWAVVSAAVLSDRLCIWRLKRVERAVEHWSQVVRVAYDYQCPMANWKVWGPHVAEMWWMGRQIFAKKLDDSSLQPLSLAVFEQLKQKWHKLLMLHWVEQRKIKIAGGIATKLKALADWQREKKAAKCSLDPPGPIQFGTFTPPDVEAEKIRDSATMRRLWCQTVVRLENGRGEWELLNKLIDTGFKNVLEKVWRGNRTEEQTQSDVDMAIQGLIYKYHNNHRQTKGSGMSDEELRCLLQEVAAGHWNLQLNFLVGKAPKMNAIEQKMEEKVWEWQQMASKLNEEFTLASNNPFVILPAMGQWGAELRRQMQVEAKAAQNIVSAFHLLTCAKSGEEKCKVGGTPVDAFDFAQRHGLVSGTKFEQQNGCKPYPFLPSPLLAQQRNPVDMRCQPDQCSNPRWQPQREPKARLVSSFRCELRHNFLANGWSAEEFERKIMEEIHQNGSLFVTIRQAHSLHHYQSGIYTRTAEICKLDAQYRIQGLNDSEWSHAIRLIGWGEDEKTGAKFWRAANSWGTGWGEGGFFRILRGRNEVDVEMQIGYPLIN